MIIEAPAKVNLALHILGRRPDGYHNLASVVGFTQFGDRLTIEPADVPSVRFVGPFADGLDAEDNSIIDSMKFFNATSGHETNFAVTCEKNIPAQAGLGGGTADAAAVLKYLYEWYELPSPNPSSLVHLGADVPVSFFGQPAVMRGIGANITAADFCREWGIVLCNPMIAVPTGEVFGAIKEYSLDLKDRNPWTIADLNETQNTMTSAAISIARSIETRIDALTAMRGDLVRMTGSGATVFALTADPEMMAARYRKEFPDDWVMPSYIKRSTT